MGMIHFFWVYALKIKMLSLKNIILPSIAHHIYIGGVSEEEKHKRELETMDQISKMLGPLMGGDEMLSLWKEYEACNTEEAKLLKDLDKIEMILQAQEYEAEGSNGQSLDEFFTSTEGKWRTEIGKAWAEEIVSRRKKPTDAK